MELVYQNLRVGGSQTVYLSPATIFKYAKNSEIDRKRNKGPQNMLVQTIITHGGENKKKMTHVRVVIDKSHRLTNETQEIRESKKK